MCNVPFNAVDQSADFSSIDTGIDYTNPFLGGAFGPGNKVIGGFDFVGDAYGQFYQQYDHLNDSTDTVCRWYCYNLERAEAYAYDLSQAQTRPFLIRTLLISAMVTEVMLR